MSRHVAGTTPYPWPYDGHLDLRATALLVVAPAGAAQHGPDDLLARLGALAAAVRSGGGAVIAATTDRPGRHAVGRDAPGGASNLLPAGIVDEVITAGGVDAFYASDLDLLLRTRGLTRLLLAGVGLETCIHSTMRDANDRGYECLLVVDACLPVDAELVSAAVSMIEMSGGIFGAVGRTADVLAALAPEGALT